MMLLVMTVITGVIYPLAMTGLMQVMFPHQANGSLVESHGATVGSSQIAQKFTSDKYFWERPSAIDYNPIPSGASNYGPTSLSLDTLIRQRRDTFLVNNHLPAGTQVPLDMINASGSGLDPHISPQAALLQVGRVAHARNLDSMAVVNLVHDHTEGRELGIFGDPRVNVLELNIALDNGHR